MRAFVERHGGDYKVRKLFSLCGPQEGIGRRPQVAMYQALCPVFEMDPYGAEVPIAFSGYWKDVRDEKAYLEHNHFLPDVNNERPRRNETYRENMLALEAYVLVHATADSMIVPRESELHGFFAWGDTTGRKIVPMEASDGYSDGRDRAQDAGRERPPPPPLLRRRPPAVQPLVPRGAGAAAAGVTL